MLLLLIPATSVWRLSKLWGGGIPNSDIDHSAHRLRRLTLHFILSLPPHLFLLSFLDRSFPPLSYRLSICSRSLSKPSCFTWSPHPLLMRSAAHLGTAWTCHHPASAARPCALRHVPASYAVPVLVRSPPFRPRPAPRSLSAWGGSSVAGPSTSPCPCLSLPDLFSESWHRPVLGIVIRWVFAKRREARVSPLPVSRAPFPSLPFLLVHAGIVQANRLPTPFPSLPLPLFFVIPYPSVEEVWGVALGLGVKGAYSSHGRGCSVGKTEGQVKPNNK